MSKTHVWSQISREYCHTALVDRTSCCSKINKNHWPLKNKCNLGPYFFLFALLSVTSYNLVVNTFLASEDWALYDGEKLMCHSRTVNLALYTVNSNRSRSFLPGCCVLVCHCSCLGFSMLSSWLDSHPRNCRVQRCQSSVLLYIGFISKVKAYLVEYAMFSNSCILSTFLLVITRKFSQHRL